jgi:hypothetical protein
MKRSRRIDAGFSWHVFALIIIYVNFSPMSIYFLRTACIICKRKIDALPRNAGATEGVVAFLYPVGA